MQFSDPAAWPWLFVAPALVAVALLAAVLRRRADAAARVPGLAAQVLTAPGLARARLVLLSGGALALALALLGPRWGTGVVAEREPGIDIAVVVDVSASMGAADVAPTRLKRVLVDLAALADLMSGDRLALVPFAGYAYVMCPLTADAGAFRLFLDSVDTGLVGAQGTDIAAALAVARQALDSRYKRHKAVLLFSDGEAHEGDAAAAAAELHDKHGIRVFTVGVGSRDGAPVPLDTGMGLGADTAWKKDKDGKEIRSLLDEKTLAEMARRGGGEYFRMQETRFDVAGLAARLAAAGRDALGERRRDALVDRAPLFAGIGVACLLAGLLLPQRRRPRSVP